MRKIYKSFLLGLFWMMLVVSDVNASEKLFFSDNIIAQKDMKTGEVKYLKYVKEQTSFFIVWKHLIASYHIFQKI